MVAFYTMDQIRLLLCVHCTLPSPQTRSSQCKTAMDAQLDISTFNLLLNRLAKSVITREASQTRTSGHEIQNYKITIFL